jgi:hypothetical protein
MMMNNNRMNNIMNDLFDILISSVKMVMSYGRDVWEGISWIWKEDHLTSPKNEDNYIWNGGDTFRIDDDENTKTPYDDDVVVRYDGIMDEIDE